MTSELCDGVSQYNEIAEPDKTYLLVSRAASAGGTVCTEVVIVSSSQLVCSAPVSPVGAYPLTVSLNGQNSTADSDVKVYRLCGGGQFGSPGQECSDCPAVRTLA